MGISKPRLLVTVFLFSWRTTAAVAGGLLRERYKATSRPTPSLSTYRYAVLHVRGLIGGIADPCSALLGTVLLTSAAGISPPRWSFGRLSSTAALLLVIVIALPGGSQTCSISKPATQTASKTA